MFIQSAFRNHSLLKGTFSAVRKMSSAAMNNKYETLNVSVPKEFVYHVELNRPKQLNAMNHNMWLEINQCFQTLDEDENCRVVVLSAAGKIFSAGLDLKDAMETATKIVDITDVARKAKHFRKLIQLYQSSLTSIEVCKKPVLIGIHSGCIGAGVDLICATDVRYCTKDAWFEIKEVQIGMAADVGTLQRLPKIIGNQSLVRELCFTGRKFQADEALSSGLVSKVFENKESMLQDLLTIADTIASLSPVGVQTTKTSLNYSRDHTVQEGLDHIANLNQLMLQSEDFMEATVAAATKQPKVVFSKL